MSKSILKGNFNKTILRESTQIHTPDKHRSNTGIHNGLANRWVSGCHMKGLEEENSPGAGFLTRPRGIA